MATPNFNYANYPSNNNVRFMNPNNLNFIIGQLGKRLSRMLSDDELEIVKTIARNEDSRRYSDVNRFLNAVIEKSATSINRRTMPRNVDTHEMIKGLMVEEDKSQNDQSYGSKVSSVLNSLNAQVNIAGILGINRIADLTAIISPNNAQKSAEILLDSRWRSLDTDGTVNIKWTFTTSNNPTQGTTNNTNNIRNLRAIKIRHPPRIPFPANADSIYDRVSMAFSEFYSQASIDQEGAYHHFWFKPNRQGQYMELEISSYDDGIFEFATPIASLDTLTISFGKPLSRIKFDQDRSTSTILSYGVNTTIQTNIVNNLTTGDQVIMSEFTTANPTYDRNIINAINNPEGVTIDNSSVVDPEKQFIVPIDTSYLINLTPPGTISISNGSATVTGVGTSFYSLFNPGDVIKFNNNSYFVLRVNSQVSLTLTEPFVGINQVNVAYQKNNTIPGLVFTCYFASKRIFIPLQLFYIDALIN